MIIGVHTYLLNFLHQLLTHLDYDPLLLTGKLQNPSGLISATDCVRGTSCTDDGYKYGADLRSLLRLLLLLLQVRGGSPGGFIGERREDRRGLSVRTHLNRWTTYSTGEFQYFNVLLGLLQVLVQIKWL